MPELDKIRRKLKFLASPGIPLNRMGHSHNYPSRAKKSPAKYRQPSLSFAIPSGSMRTCHRFFNLLIALIILVSCGSERTSHPDIQGEWVLVQAGKERVAEKNSYALRITENAFELRELGTGEPVWGGVRFYHWEGAKIVIAPLEGSDTPVTSVSAAVLSASKTRLEFAAFFDWPRAAFRRSTYEEWSNVILTSTMPEKPEWMIHLDSQLQGTWEGNKNPPPFSFMGLVVEIGDGQIRSQAFATGIKKKDLFGKEEPCTYKYKGPLSGDPKTLTSIDFNTPVAADVFCPNNHKTYPMEVVVESNNAIRVKLLGFEVPLLRIREKRFQSLAKKFDLRRLRSEKVFTQTNAEGVSP